VPIELDSAALYRTHRRALVDYASRITGDRERAEDVVQDAWERIEAVERRRVLAKPLGYFYRIVRNLALDGLRVRKRDLARAAGAAAGALEAIPDDAPSPESGLIAREELRIVLESLGQLPERTRLALTLHTIEGLTLRDVAERLGVSTARAHALVVEAKLYCAKQLKRRP
jgi:RNA polymerase sigma-70 factor (ECF subfamily)